MHAWIGFIFSCTMIIIAALGKSGYQIIPGEIAGTPAREFIFLLGCACFGAVMSTLAPTFSPARIAALWSSAALGFVVVVTNLNAIAPQTEPRVVETAPATQQPEEKPVERKAINLVLKKSIREDDWAPFSDFDRRVRQLDQQQVPLPAINETNQPLPQRPQ
jgi:acyl-CoA synthetase (AMP-forming)/AMP-acid ligase II